MIIEKKYNAYKYTLNKKLKKYNKQLKNIK